MLPITEQKAFVDVLSELLRLTKENIEEQNSTDHRDIFFQTLTDLKSGRLNHESCSKNTPLYEFVNINLKCIVNKDSQRHDLISHVIDVFLLSFYLIKEDSEKSLLNISSEMTLDLSGNMLSDTDLGVWGLLKRIVSRRMLRITQLDLTHCNLHSLKPELWESLSNLVDSMPHLCILNLERNDLYQLFVGSSKKEDFMQFYTFLINLPENNRPLSLHLKYNSLSDNEHVELIANKVLKQNSMICSVDYEEAPESICGLAASNCWLIAKPQLTLINTPYQSGPLNLAGLLNSSSKINLDEYKQYIQHAKQKNDVLYALLICIAHYTRIADGDPIFRLEDISGISLEPILIEAINSSNHHLIQTILCSEVNVNWRSPNDTKTPLMIAAHRGDIRACLLLINEGADINCCTSAEHRSMTAMMLASENGHDEVVYVLLHLNANPYCKDSMGNSALMLAILNGYANVVSVLRDSRDIVQHVNFDGDNPLTLAVKQGDRKLIQALIETHPRLGSTMLMGEEALNLAILRSDMDTCELLREYGCVKLPDSDKINLLIKKAVRNRNGDELSAYLLYAQSFHAVLYAETVEDVYEFILSTGDQGRIHEFFENSEEYDCVIDNKISGMKLDITRYLDVVDENAFSLDDNTIKIIFNYAVATGQDKVVSRSLEAQPCDKLYLIPSKRDINRVVVLGAMKKSSANIACMLLHAYIEQSGKRIPFSVATSILKTIYKRGKEFVKVLDIYHSYFTHNRLMTLRGFSDDQLKQCYEKLIRSAHASALGKLLENLPDESCTPLFFNSALLFFIEAQNLGAVTELCSNYISGRSNMLDADLQVMFHYAFDASLSSGVHRTDQGYEFASLVSAYTNSVDRIQKIMSDLDQGAMPVSYCLKKDLCEAMLIGAAIGNALDVLNSIFSESIEFSKSIELSLEHQVEAHRKSLAYAVANGNTDAAMAIFRHSNAIDKRANMKGALLTIMMNSGVAAQSNTMGNMTPFILACSEATKSLQSVRRPPKKLEAATSVVLAIMLSGTFDYPVSEIYAKHPAIPHIIDNSYLFTISVRLYLNNHILNLDIRHHINDLIFNFGCVSAFIHPAVEQIAVEHADKIGNHARFKAYRKKWEGIKEDNSGLTIFDIARQEDFGSPLNVIKRKAVKAPLEAPSATRQCVGLFALAEPSCQPGIEENQRKKRQRRQPEGRF